MGLRNQLILPQLANGTARRNIGYGLSGEPAMTGVIDLYDIGILRLMRDSTLANRFEFLDWGTATFTGLAGTISRGPNQVALSGAYSMIAFVLGLASDESEAYFSMIMASFRRGTSGDETLVGGTSTVLYEVGDVVGANSDIQGNTNGGVSVQFDSNQAVLQYTWTVKAIVMQNVNT